MKNVIGEAANERNARGTSHENDFVDLLGGYAGIFERLSARAYGAVDDGLDDLFELLTGNLATVGFMPGQIDADACCLRCRERDLGFDDRLANRLNSFGIGSQIQIEFALNVVKGDGDEQVVDIVTAEVRVSIGGDDLKDSFV